MTESQPCPRRLFKWIEYGWLRQHKTARQEIFDLLGIVDRDLSDAQTGRITTLLYNSGITTNTLKQSGI